MSSKSVVTHDKASTVMLEPDYERIQRSDITGGPSLYKIVANPNSASAGGMYYASIPSLGPDVCLIPNTLYLTAKLKCTGTKAHFRNIWGGCS